MGAGLALSSWATARTCSGRVLRQAEMVAASYAAAATLLTWPFMRSIGARLIDGT
jgi:hypothetical protein